MKEQLKSIREEALNSVKSMDNLDKLENIRIKYLGKKGELTLL